MRRTPAFAAGLAAALALRGRSHHRGHAARADRAGDTSRYPLITATVIAPNSDKLKGGAPRIEASEKRQGRCHHALGRRVGRCRSAWRSTSAARWCGEPIVAARKAALAFVQAKRPNDSMALYSFGHEANPLQALDTDTNALGTALGQLDLDTQQGTALYQSVIQASSELSTARR
jgi:hypothetical protein